MKHFRFSLLSLFVLAGILLSSCAGGMMTTSWPGLSGGKDKVYLSVGPSIMAVKVSDGSLSWKFPADKGDPTRPFYAAPAVTDSQVIVGDYCKAGSLFNAVPTCTLISLDTESGNQKWMYGQGKGKWVGSPQLVGDTILAPSADGHLYALNQNGMPRWIYKTKNSIWAQPVSDGTNAYMASMDKNLYAVRLSDGTKVWSTALIGTVVAGPTLGADGVLYLGTLAKEIVAVNAATGNILWKFATRGTVWSYPVLNEEVLYFGDSQSTTAGSVYALSVKTGALIWSVDLAGPVIASGVKTPDGLAFVTETGDVQALSLDGKKVWTHNFTKGKLYTTPVVAGDRLVVAITQGDSALVALDFNGSQVWSFILPK